MFPMSAARLAWSLGGRLAVEGKKKAYRRLTIDSRNLKKGDVFLGLRGPRFNGAHFASAALKAGAGMLVLEKASAGLKRAAKRKGAALVLVDQGRRALWRAAADQRRLFDGKVVGLTGSVGKTGAKDMLRWILDPACTWATPGNLNNQWGLPLSILGLRPGDRNLVLEMGMNHPGEITRLAGLGKPEIGLVLNVGDAHAGLLGGRAGVAKAKEELLVAMGPAGIAVVNADDPHTAAMGRRFKGRRFSFGKAASADLKIRAVDDRGAKGLRARLESKGGTVRLRLRQGGSPALQQAAAAVAVGLQLGLKPAAMEAALAKYQPSASMRLQMKPLKGFNAVLDSYNASPQSMEAALDYVSRSSKRGRRVAVLGDMLELGDDASRFHRLVGKVARQKGFRSLAAMGKHAGDLAAGFGSGAQVFRRGEYELAADWLASRLKPADWILFKGSRGMTMEKVYERLKTKVKDVN